MTARPTEERHDISALLFASRAILAAAVRALESVHPIVSLPQMRVLVLLWGGEPLNLSTVAERLGVNASNASRTCDRLVSAGLVSRTEGASDRRQVALSLTPQGASLVERLMGRREDELGAIVSKMTAPEREQLMRALAPFNRAAEEDLWPSRRQPDVRDPRLLEWGM